MSLFPRPRWHFYILRVVVAFLPCGLFAADVSDEAAPSLERLQRASLIRCVIHHPPSQRREVTFTDPAQLERVRAWIKQYAWPPIDLRTTGNVMPRGDFAIFDRADAAKPAFVVPVHGVTTRAEPRMTHVTDENWQKFLSLIPPK